MCEVLIKLDPVDRKIIEMHERMMIEASKEIETFRQLILEHKEAVWSHLENKYNLIANEGNARIILDDEKAEVVIPCLRREISELADQAADVIANLIPHQNKSKETIH